VYSRTDAFLTLGRKGLPTEGAGRRPERRLDDAVVNPAIKSRGMKRTADARVVSSLKDLL
jgi:hypothetical protein